MKRSRSLRKLLLSCGAVVGILIALKCIYLYHGFRIMMKEAATVGYLGDVRHAFCTFGNMHGRWPHSMDEIRGTEYASEGSIDDHCRDCLSDSPFLWVTKKDVRYTTENGKVLKVFIMLPKPYRTKLWPFGEFKTIILASDIGIHDVSPSDITGLEKGRKR